MPSGADLVAMALKHKGEPYLLGCDVPLQDPNWKGPWDCAEFCSWIAYQITAQIVGCIDNHVPLSKVEPFSGSWYRDGSASTRQLTIAAAAATPGALLVRRPRPEQQKIGHVVFSQGNGKTIEAMSTSRGVTEGPIEGRIWDVCFALDGVS